MYSVACLLAVMLVAAPQDIGKVASTVDKKVDFTAFHTYAWEKGHEAFDPGVHKLIVESVDAQMAGIGLQKVDAGKGDVTIRYHVIRGADVDMDLLKKLQKESQTAPAPEKILGSLAVVLYPPRGTEPLWEAHTRSHLNEDPKIREQEIRNAVVALFKTYPRPKK